MALYEGNILNSLSGNASLPEITEEELRKVVQEYPYYGAAYYLLAKKLYQEDKQNKLQAAQQAALHFSNDLWFHYNLTAQNGETTIHEFPAPAAELIIDEETNVIEEITEPLSIPIGELESTEIPVIETDEIPEDVITNQTSETEPLSNIEVEDEPEERTVSEDGEEETEPINTKLSSILQQQAAEFEKPVEETSAEIPIEITPNHRVDYFESQGIKLSENQGDKLGSKLKRFTDWLKQMKSINPNPANLGNDTAGEKEVENIANHSNEKEDILTETMADVLVKQGKPEQAIEIYEKLSFSNPSKSAYFAAKIEDLKPKQ